MPYSSQAVQMSLLLLSGCRMEETCTRSFWLRGGYGDRASFNLCPLLPCPTLTSFYPALPTLVLVPPPTYRSNCTALTQSSRCCTTGLFLALVQRWLTLTQHWSSGECCRHATTFVTLITALIRSWSNKIRP